MCLLVVPIHESTAWFQGSQTTTGHVLGAVHGWWSNRGRAVNPLPERDQVNGSRSTNPPNKTWSGLAHSVKAHESRKVYRFPGLQKLGGFDSSRTVQGGSLADAAGCMDRLNCPQFKPCFPASTLPFGFDPWILKHTEQKSLSVYYSVIWNHCPNTHTTAKTRRPGHRYSLRRYRHAQPDNPSVCTYLSNDISVYSAALITTGVEPHTPDSKTTRWHQIGG